PDDILSLSRAVDHPWSTLRTPLTASVSHHDPWCWGLGVGLGGGVVGSVRGLGCRTGYLASRMILAPLARSCHVRRLWSKSAHQNPSPSASRDAEPTAYRTHRAGSGAGPPSAATTFSRQGRMPRVWPPRRQLATA